MKEKTSMLKKMVSSVGCAAALFVLACQPAIAGEPDAKNEKAAQVKKPAAAAPPAAKSTLDASKLRLEVGRAGLTDSNFVEIFGEVHNDTGQPIEWVKINIELVDKDGNALDVGGWHREVVNAEHARGELHYVPAGGSTPFHYIRDASKIKGTYAGQKMTVTARPRTGPMPTAVVEGLNATPRDLGQVDLKGTLKITGTVDCRSPMAVVGFYDEKTNKLIDLVHPHKSALEAHFQKKVAAGQSIAFEGKSFPKGATANSKTKVWAVCDNWIAD